MRACALSDGSVIQATLVTACGSAARTRDSTWRISISSPQSCGPARTARTRQHRDAGLDTAPGAWTYVTPTSFTGNWSIELANPGYAEAVTLSVSYLSARNISEYGNASRLAFTIAGGGVSIHLVPEQLVPAGPELQPA